VLLKSSESERRLTDRQSRGSHSAAPEAFVQRIRCFRLDVAVATKLQVAYR
jgi:hypothetical protein